MKKLSLLLAIASVSCLYVSCKKSTPMTSKDLNIEKPTAMFANSSAVEHWEEAVKDCITPALNCGATVAIKAANFNSLVAVINTNGTPQSIALYFSSPQGLLTAQDLGIDPNDLQNLQSGNYTVIYDASGSTLGKIYFFFGPAPLSRQNAEYIIPTTH